MSVILSAALLASFASAQITTSLWMPGLAASNLTFVGSVISADEDRTTLSVQYQDPDMTENESHTEAPNTVTLGGNTYVGFQASQPYPGETDLTLVISAACSRSNTDADATCEMSTSGMEPIKSALCAEGDEAIAEYCTGTEGLDDTLTTTLPAMYFGTFPLVITAGEDNLPASAAATPSASGASMTAASSGSGTGSATGTGSSQADNASASGTVVEATGAAPVMTMAPALAGLGAAAAAFFL